MVHIDILACKVVDAFKLRLISARPSRSKFLRFWAKSPLVKKNPAKTALFALAEINYCQGNFFPLVAEIADGTSDASRVAVVKS